MKISHINHNNHSFLIMELSIIIPVYNVGRLLDKCLGSIYNKGLEDDAFEVIVVDDASPSFEIEKEIVGKYAKIHNNLVVLRHAKNKGLSASRNTGLSHAHGEYAWFVDSDDSINAVFVQSLLDNAISLCLDVLCFGFRMVEEDSMKCTDCVIEGVEGRVFPGPEFLIDVPVQVMAWSAIFRRQFLIDNDLYFMEGILHEDQEFTPRAYSLANRILYMPLPVYNYLQRSGSIMKSINPKKIKDLITICRRLWDFSLKNTMENSELRFFFVNRISFLYSQSLRNMAICGFENYSDLPFYPLSINRFLTLREKLQYTLINVNVKLYVFIKRMMFSLGEKGDKKKTKK